MQQTVSAQVRPVVTAISSLEKVIEIQEDRRVTNISNTPAPKGVVWNYDKIQSVVEDVVQQRYPHINESVTNRSLEASLSQHKEYLLHEMGYVFENMGVYIWMYVFYICVDDCGNISYFYRSQTESIRLELAAAQRESVGVVRKRVDEKVSDLTVVVRESRYEYLCE